MGPYCSINGELKDRNTASIGIQDTGLLRGYAVFDFLRVRENVPLYLGRHLDRLLQSVESMKIQMDLSKSDLERTVRDLLMKNNSPRSSFRFVITGGYAQDGMNPTSANVIITQENLPSYPDSYYADGCKLISRNFTRYMPETKTTQYAEAVRMGDIQRQSSAVDILYHSDGVIRETARSNIFAVLDDRYLVTPSEGILKGITRMNVLDVAQGHFRINESNISLQDLLNAKEVFITGTTKSIMPVRQIDDTVIGGGKPGKNTLELMERLETFELAHIRKYKQIHA